MSLAPNSQDKYHMSVRLKWESFCVPKDFLNFLELHNNSNFCKSKPFKNVLHYLEVEDDGPYQPQGQLGVSIGYVIVPDIDQFDLKGSIYAYQQTNNLLE